MKFQNEKGEFPRYLGDLRLVKENWQFGDPLPKGWIQVSEYQMQEERYGYVQEFSTLNEIEGNLTEVYKFRKLTAKELARMNNNV